MTLKTINSVFTRVITRLASGQEGDDVDDDIKSCRKQGRGVSSKCC